MKTHPVLMLVIMLSGLFCFENEIVASDQDEPASIWFFRLPNYAGSGARMTIMSDDQPVVRLKNASYFKFAAQPGEHTFSFSFGSPSNLKLLIEPGKDYYIKCYINTGVWSAIPVMELVEPASGKSFVEGKWLSEQMPESISLEKKYSRAGIFLSGGIGFEKVDWFIDEDGNDVTLSTGGGFSIGAELGRQFGKAFDLSASCFFQGSTLSISLKNASGSFNRMGISVTPALVIPVKGGDYMRFRIGAGPGLYSFGTMKIDGSEIGDTKYTFKYKPAFGIHGVILFESNFMERGSMNLGVRYSNIKYEYTSEGSSHIVTDQRLLSPDGSGLDFILGYSFHF